MCINYYSKIVSINVMLCLDCLLCLLLIMENKQINKYYKQRNSSFKLCNVNNKNNKY